MPGDRCGSVNPTRSKVKKDGLRPSARTFEGGPPEFAGRPHEAVGNGSPRWMVADRSTARCAETEPGLQASSSLASPCPAETWSGLVPQSADSPQELRAPSRPPPGSGRQSPATGGRRCRASRPRWRARAGTARSSPIRRGGSAARRSSGAGRETRCRQGVPLPPPPVARCVRTLGARSGLFSRVKIRPSMPGGWSPEVCGERVDDDLGERDGADAGRGLRRSERWWPAGRVSSWRSTSTVRRRKSTRSTVRPRHSPWRIPVPAATITSARSWPGIAAATACTCSVVGGHHLRAVHPGEPGALARVRRDPAVPHRGLHDPRDDAVHDANGRGRQRTKILLAGAETGNPRLDVTGQNRRKRLVAECRVSVPAQHGFDVRLCRGAVHLHGAPPLGVLPERDRAGLRIDVTPGDHRRRDLIDPPLGIDLAGEVARALLACRVPVPRPPTTVRTLLNVGH